MTPLMHKHINGRKLLEKNRPCKSEQRFENLAPNNVIPNGYLTSEEFRKRAIVKVNTFCAEHGIL